MGSNVDISVDEFFAQVNKTSKSPKTRKKTPISYEAVSMFIDALRETLRDDKRESNCFRFLLENEPADAEVEKAKGYLNRPTGAVTLLAIMQVIKKWYTVHETWETSWEDMEHASELEVSVAYNKTELVYENGYIELTNRKNNQRIMLHINTESQSPYYKVYALDGCGEAALLVKRIKKQEKVNNLYKNKSFTLENVYGVGMVPKFVKFVKVKPDQIVIPTAVADIIQANVLDVFLKRKEYEENQIPTKRGILMEGPPGNGKSSIVKYINSALDGQVTFIYITDGVIRNASDISEIFALARAYQPSMVIFEDIDTIGLSRGLSGGGSNFTSELLGQLDGLETLDNFVVIATTNHSELIDDALKNRPGRFDRRIKIALPNEKLRAKMLENFTKEKRVVLTQEQIDGLASDKLTKGFSGASLKEAIITAKMYAMDDKEKEIFEHLKDAIKFIRQQYYDDKNISSVNDSVGFRQRD
jgi:hypothetical protein